MNSHTPGPWRAGKPSDSVVSDAPDSCDSSHVDYYGGNLIAESIQPSNRPLIVAAPDLLRCAMDFSEVLKELGLFCECGEEDCRTTRLRAAIAKATGDAA